MSIHICFLITRGDSIGGAQIHVRDMAIALKSDGYEVTVLSGTSGDLTSQLDAADIRWEVVPRLIRPISPIRDLQAIFSVSYRLRKLKPDLLSCHTAKAGMVGRVSAYLSRVPSLFTAHGWQFADGIPDKQAKAVLLIEKITSSLCRKVITVSRYDFNLAIRKRAVKKEKLETIHNGLPWLDCFSGMQSCSVLERDAVCRLIMVARFQAQKDHAALFNALADLTDLSWNLELVGDGPGMEAEKARVHDLKLDSRINFTGQRLDVPERLERSDIYLLVSNWEGFPRSIIEAMRAGLPVISSDVGGCSESVIDGKTGYLVARGDVEALKASLSTLISDFGLRKRMGTEGRLLYENKFTFMTMYNKTVNLYHEILSS